jgi:rhodanese-related sulfurtransferase
MPVPRVTKEELKQRLDGPADQAPVILDVRLKYPFEHSTVTLPGAIRMPAGALDTNRLPRDRDIVLYDSDPDELVSEPVAAELIRHGYRAFALKGGIGEWVGAKLPVASKPAPQAASPATGTPKG